MKSDEPKNWEDQGCVECRQAALTGLNAPLVMIGNISGWNHLYQCEICQAYWEETQRYAHEISEVKAQEMIGLIKNGTKGYNAIVRTESTRSAHLDVIPRNDISKG